MRGMHVRCAGSVCGRPREARDARVFIFRPVLGLNSVRLENFGSFCFLRCSTFDAFFKYIHFYDVVLAAL